MFCPKFDFLLSLNVYTVMLFWSICEFSFQLFEKFHTVFHVVLVYTLNRNLTAALMRGLSPHACLSSDYLCSLEKAILARVRWYHCDLFAISIWLVMLEHLFVLLAVCVILSVKNLRSSVLLARLFILFDVGLYDCFVDSWNYCPFIGHTTYRYFPPQYLGVFVLFCWWLPFFCATAVNGLIVYAVKSLPKYQNSSSLCLLWGFWSYICFNFYL